METSIQQGTETNKHQLKSIVSGLIYDPRTVHRLSVADVRNIIMKDDLTESLTKSLAAMKISSKGVDRTTEIPIITVSDYSTEPNLNLLPETMEDCRKKSYYERLMIAGESKQYLKPPCHEFQSIVKHKSFDAAYMFKFRKNAHVKPSSFSTYFTNERRDPPRYYNFQQRRFSDSFTTSTKVGYSIRPRSQLKNGYPLLPEQTYCLGQTKLYWRSLPSKESKATILANSSHRDILTVLFCTNFNGSHRMKPLVIGSTRDPRVIRNFEAFVVYKYSRDAQITIRIFNEWFFQHFVKEVPLKLIEQGFVQQSILFLDPSVDKHPPLAELVCRKNQMKTIKLCTNIIVDQTIVGLARIEYKKRLLLDAVACPNKFTKLGDAVPIIRLAWDTVRPFAIEKCCRFVLPSEDRSKGIPEWNPTVILRSLQLQHISLMEIRRLLHCLPGGNELSKNEIDNWIYYDQGLIINKNPFF